MSVFSVTREAEVGGPQASGHFGLYSKAKDRKKYTET